MTGAPVSTACLTARGLAIGWHARAGLPLARGIDVELDLGDFAALIGPNGSGKSTLLRTLGGLRRRWAAKSPSGEKTCGGSP